MNQQTEGGNRSAIFYGLLPLLILSDSFSAGIVLGISFLFCYIVTTVFLLLKKEDRPQSNSSLMLFLINSICISLILSVTRIINPFLFEVVSLKTCIIPLVPVLFKVRFSLDPRDHELGLRELLYGMLFSLVILITGFSREFLVSFSFLAVFRDDEKAVPFLPVLNQPAGAFILIALVIGSIRYIKRRKGDANE